MDLIPSRGRPGATLLLTVERELTSADIFRLATEETAKVSAPAIQKLRASHHQAARLLATGKSIRETAIIVGRTPQRIGDLTRDPAFQELISYYSNQIGDAEITDAQRIQSLLVEVAELATLEIRERLEDDEKRAAMPVSELRQLGSFGLDRTVAPPKQSIPQISTPLKVTFNVGNKVIQKESSSSTTEDDRPIFEHQTTPELTKEE